MKSLLFAIVFTASMFAPLHAQVHPRLLVSGAELPALRAKIKKEPHRSMVEELKKTAEMDQWGAAPMTQGRADYNEATAAVRCAFLYTLTGDDSWARKARGYVEKRISEKNWAEPRTKGLTLFMNGRAVALAYDFCHGAPSWDAAFSDRVSKSIFQLANAIFDNGGSEQNTNPASNWQGLRWSVAGLMYLASDEPVDAARLEHSYKRVAQYLSTNLGESPASRGWNSEGLGYTFFPLANGVVPFAVAINRQDPAKDLRKTVPGAAYSLWTTYAAIVPTGEGLRRPDFSDDHPHADGEGAYGFAFYFSRPTLVPGLKYWYDRTIGLQGDKSFDRARLGLVASILYYPGDEVSAVDPMKIPDWMSGFVDTGGNGMQTWRNRYRDTGDIVSQFYAKLRGNRGHNGPDSLNFRIVGLNTIWATGGGRYGKKIDGQEAYWRSMNTVYPVDPDSRISNNEVSGQLVGTPVSTPEGGHVVAKAPQNNVGTSQHQRWFAVSHDPATGGASYVVHDSSQNGRFWQFCTLETNTITTQGNTFTITSPDGHSLRGTVLYPAEGVVLKTGTRIRGSDAGKVKQNNYVHFGSPDGTFLVAMTLLPKGVSHPQAAARGIWGEKPAGQVAIGRAIISIEGEKITTTIR